MQKGIGQHSGCQRLGPGFDSSVSLGNWASCLATGSFIFTSLACRFRLGQVRSLGVGGGCASGVKAPPDGHEVSKMVHNF